MNNLRMHHSIWIVCLRQQVNLHSSTWRSLGLAVPTDSAVLLTLVAWTCRTMLLQRRGALMNVTGDATALSAAAPHISGFLSALPAEAGAPSDWRSTLPRQNEALIVPTQVHW